MNFPVSPSDGQLATVNNIQYQYSSATNAWTRSATPFSAITATGNISGGNLLTTGLVSATGNVTGNYILGNGALLTGVITSVANINYGNSNVTVVSSGGNITVGVGGTSNVVVWAPTGEIGRAHV